MVTQAPSTTGLIEPATPGWAQRLVLRLVGFFVAAFPVQPVRFWDASPAPGNLPPPAAWNGSTLYADGALWLSNGVTWVKVGPTDLSGFAPLNSPAFTGTPTAPTPPQFDDTTKLATTAWVNRRGHEYRAWLAVPAGTVFTVAHVGAVIGMFDAVGTYTLPLSSTTRTGATMNLFSAGRATIQVQGADLIFSNSGGGLAASLLMVDGDTLSLISTGGGGWVVAGGSAPGRRVRPWRIPGASTALLSSDLGGVVQMEAGFTLTLPVPGVPAFPYGATVEVLAFTGPFNIVGAAGAGIANTQTAAFVAAGTPVAVPAVNRVRVTAGFQSAWWLEIAR